MLCRCNSIVCSHCTHKPTSMICYHAKHSALCTLYWCLEGAELLTEVVCPRAQRLIQAYHPDAHSNESAVLRRQHADTPGMARYIRQVTSQAQHVPCLLQLFGDIQLLCGGPCHTCIKMYGEQQRHAKDTGNKQTDDWACQLKPNVKCE